MRRVKQVTVLPPVGWRKWLDVTPDQPYQGEVYSAEGIFELESSGNQPNSLFPVIMGGVVPTEIGEGSAVRLTMRMRPARQFLATVWMAITGAICLLMLVIRPGWVGVIPFLMFGGTPLLFWLQVWENKRFFQNLLQLVESFPAA